MQAVGGQLAHRNVSVMPLVGSMRCMKAGPGRHAGAVCMHEGGSKNMQVGLRRVDVEPNELQLKTGISNTRCRSTYDAGGKNIPDLNRMMKQGIFLHQGCFF